MSRSTRTAPQGYEPITDLSELMPFGKYRGEKVQEILDVDPGYLVWLHNNTDVDLSCHILETAEEAMRPNHEFRHGTASELRERLITKLT